MIVASWKPQWLIKRAISDLLRVFDCHQWSGRNKCFPMDIYRIYMCIQYISESTPAMFVKFWKWILIFNSICALISCIISEETNSETFKVLQLPFGESCLHQLIDLRVIPLSKVDADFLKMTTTKANHPPPTQMRLWGMCMTFCAANNFWLSKRLQMIMK